MSLSSPGQCPFFLAVGVAQLWGLNSVFFMCQVNLIAKFTYCWASKITIPAFLVTQQLLH